MVALEARPFFPYDLPLVLRLFPHGVMFDSEIALTDGARFGVGSAVLSALPFTDFSTHTFVLRESEGVAQFRHRTGDYHAHITFIAPELSTPRHEDRWTTLIDAMVHMAGKRSAHSLNAEVDENSQAFVIMRRCGFAVYARQELWRREPAPLPVAEMDLLRPATEADAFAINMLYANIVPRLVLQADDPPDPSRGWVYKENGRITAFIAVTEGKSGIYLQPFFHPEMERGVGAVLTAALARCTRAERLPTYICIRRYQDWLRASLPKFDFEPLVSQAVMVKHTVARIERPALVPAMAGAVRLVSPIKMVRRNKRQRK